ncbi:hypothetical protein J1N35_036976 [Gossypium stocksii]|uniref:Macro domain-containing protein n=1 Tax=Gossypium stocksii TaxID=47602 RepID=A0A9D3UJ55_9ROSI|nr:hypothetical protein J1N35_036976 [Gossypium stocksii]
MASATGGKEGEEVGNIFKLSETTVLKIQKGDITLWFLNGSSDAIVNPANERMLGGGGADGAIHRAAGPELVEACYKVPEVEPDVRCPTGEARITPGFKLPASHVIHTVGPIYDSDKDPKASLTSAYENCLSVAKENNIEYIAFTAISCGVYGVLFNVHAWENMIILFYKITRIYTCILLKKLRQLLYLLSKTLQMALKRYTLFCSRINCIMFG